MTATASADAALPAPHPFVLHPHRTLIALSVPVTLSLIAEPITGLVDSAFLAQLGTAPLAALGVATAVLSTVFWIFYFIGISAQTQVAQALGAGDPARAAQITSLALILSGLFSAIIIVILLAAGGVISAALGAEGAVLDATVTYLHVRALGAPAVLLTFTGFGVMRGLQDMRTPLLIATGLNALNIVLDGPLIFGFGPLPALGVGGAALASVISQWAGAAAVLWMLRRQLGLTVYFSRAEVGALLRVGGNLFVRTGLLTAFLLISTRTANQISPEAGAAQQAVRSVWLFIALMLDGFAVTAQSLVGYFVGARDLPQARRAAALALGWGAGVGVLLTVGMLLATPLVIALLVPPQALAAFQMVWVLAALTQPLSGLAFVTDGVHWGTGDFAYLRNVMLLATLIAGGGLLLLDLGAPGAFMWVWLAMLLFLGIRAAFGIVRVWPGLGQGPLTLKPTAG